MVKPITPKQVRAFSQTAIPTEVVSVWNEMIIAKFRNDQAKIMQDDIVSALAKAMNVPRQKVFDSGWVDIEDLYEKSGWEVTYDKPAYDENYTAFFLFSPKSIR
jgi:hypothetical protein